MKPNERERREAARAQMECIGDIICDKASAQAAKVCRRGAKIALQRWVVTGKMFR